MSTYKLITRDQQFSRKVCDNSQQRKSKWLLNMWKDESLIIREMQTEITMKYLSHLSERQNSPVEGNLATSTKIKMYIPLTQQLLF